MKATTAHVRRAIDGDEEALGWLIQRFTPFLEVQIQIRVGGRGSSQDVEDMVADVWVVALQRMRDIRPREGRYTPALAKFLGSTAIRTANGFPTALDSPWTRARFPSQ